LDARAHRIAPPPGGAHIKFWREYARAIPRLEIPQNPAVTSSLVTARSTPARPQCRSGGRPAPHPPGSLAKFRQRGVVTNQVPWPYLPDIGDSSTGRAALLLHRLQRAVFSVWTRFNPGCLLADLVLGHVQIEVTDGTMSLGGKRVIVIGGSSGIGFASAALARDASAEITGHVKAERAPGR
jgi:hypothetical protein